MTDRQRRRSQRGRQGGQRPWYAPAQWMWSKRPRRKDTWTGIAGWVFVLAGIASFFVFKGATSALTMSFCAVGFAGSAYAGHRVRNKTYGRGSETVRPMSRTEARQYAQATRDGQGRVPEQDPNGSGRTWVASHARDGTGGVDGHYRARPGDARADEREQAHARERTQDAKTRTRVKSRASWIEGEWWEGDSDG